MKKGRDPSILYQDEMRVICSMNQRDYAISNDMGNLKGMKIAITTVPCFRIRVNYLRRTRQAVRIYLPLQCVLDLQRACSKGECLIAMARFDHHVQYGLRVIPEDQLIMQGGPNDNEGDVLIEWRLVLSGARPVDANEEDRVNVVTGIIRFNE